MLARNPRRLVAFVAAAVSGLTLSTGAAHAAESQAPLPAPVITLTSEPAAQAWLSTSRISGGITFAAGSVYAPEEIGLEYKRDGQWIKKATLDINYNRPATATGQRQAGFRADVAFVSPGAWPIRMVIPAGLGRPATISPVGTASVGTPKVTTSLSANRFAGGAGEALPVMAATIKPARVWSVALQQARNGAWVTTRTQRTTSTGRVSATLDAAAGTTAWRWKVMGGRFEKNGYSSAARVVSTVPAPTASLSSTAVRAGRYVALTGSVPSMGRSRQVTASVMVNGGSKVLAHGTSNAAGRVRLKVPTTWAAAQKVVLTVKRTGTLPADTSQSRNLTVRLPYTPTGSERSNSRLAAGVRWNPCQPLTYQLNMKGAPPQFRQAVTYAMSQITLHSGLTFVSRGSTKLSPSVNAKRKRADITLGWASVAQRPSLRGHLGQSGHSAVWIPAADRAQPARTKRAVGGFVVLNSASKYRSGARLKTLVMHELGHAVGLGHTRGAHEVMQPNITGVAPRFGAGDAAGLRALGLGRGCLLR